MEPVNPHGWYTTAQAGKLIGVSRDTIVTWINAGVMTCERNPDLTGKGRTRRRIPGAEVLRVIGKRALDAQPIKRGESPMERFLKRCQKRQMAKQTRGAK